MPIAASYLAVILIWSTTPLGIQWSGQEVGYEFGVAARMAIGLVLLLLIIRLRRLPLPFDTAAIKVYLVGGLSICIAMSFVYWSAQFIPSGWISVVFGLSPIVTSLLAALILGEQAFANGKLPGMLLGLVGLALVFVQSLDFAAGAWLGVVGVFISVLAHSSSAVILKRMNSNLPALSITTGALILALPLLTLNVALGPGLPQELPLKSMAAIVYLAVMGTALGFPLYYYLLHNISAGRLALITLITPVTALLLGAWLNDEPVSAQVWLGTGFIVLGLSLYEFGHHLKWPGVLHRLSPRWRQRPM